MSDQPAQPADFGPPFPYFGGKSMVAPIVWSAFGDVENYVEPFFGTGAVLFRRTEVRGVETANDADGLLANFWRATQRDSDAVAEHADNPVNECDLHARHLWLNGQRDRITERLMGDPDFYDAKAAGWWVWGACCWIGHGWCIGKGPWVSVDGVMVLGDTGTGVKRQRPHMGNAGTGVNRQLPHMGGCDGRRAYLKAMLAAYRYRLRHVRVACGDWSRVCGPSVTHKHGTTGVFLDPPYSAEAGRDMNCYAVDCGSVAHRVREWAVEAGKRKDMRIILAGYEGEHPMPPDWRVVAWKAHGGYGNQADENPNAHRERLWMSPACAAANDDGCLFATANEGDRP